MKKVIFLCFLFFCFSPVFSQVLSKREFIKSVRDADLFYYGKDYVKAASLYEILSKNYPDNSNLSAKLGICYLNTDGKKADALRLLLKAYSNVVTNDKEYSEYGEKAALDTYMYLAIAYHQNDSLQNAVSHYLDAKKKLEGINVLQQDYIDKQIRDCRYAIEMEKKPLTLVSDLFTPWLTEYPGACNPVLSKNDSVFIFTQLTDGKTRILCSYKSGTWERPVDITKELGGYDRFYSNSITGDGRLLVIFMDDGDDGNLYYSQRNKTTWSKIKSFGRPVNSVYWESHGFITPDGKTMYFVSNRPGGEGEFDIWISEKADDDTWNRPANCGKVINTPYNENTPFYDPSSKTLIFSSEGHTGMGGFDVFRSTLRNGYWTEPVGLPYPLNNTIANTFFINNNNSTGYITSIYNVKNKSRNIYSTIAEDPADKVIIAQSFITLQDKMPVNPKQLQIKLIDLKKGTQFKSISLTDSASFKFEIKPGDYQLFISHPGYKTDTINLNVPLFFSGNYISVNSSLVPEKVFEGNFLLIKNILFDFDCYNLDGQAISNLDNIKSVLISYPELKIEVTGYTDIKGSTEYNNKLADKRAQAVIDYLSSFGISGSRLLKTAYRKSNFVSENTYPDGSDNPEGRKYNRRVVFGILDQKTGIIINQETYTPEHLRQKSSLQYSIVLNRSMENLESSYFNSLKINDLNLIRLIKTDSVSLFIIGVFNSKIDALKYLDYAKKIGFVDAYIVNQYEINSGSKSLINDKSESLQIDGEIVYTIQLIATKGQTKMNLFKGIDGVREIVSSDGFYRYVCGEYNSFSSAKAALVKFQQSGFKDAFIKELNSFTQK